MSFEPTNPDFKPELKGYKKYGAFRFWCQQVLPLTFDDSLSYYELLNKLVDYLNKTMDNVNTLGGDVESLGNAYNELEDNVVENYNKIKNYLDTYFENLDVQDQIDNKLDEMASDGSLSTLLAPIVPELVTNWLQQNVTPVGSAVIVNPGLNISGAAGDAEVIGKAIGYNPITLTRGGYIETSGTSTDYTVVENNSYWYSVVDCNNSDIFTISGRGSNTARLWAFVDENGNILSKATVNATETNTIIYAPAGAAKLVINSLTNETSYKGYFSVQTGLKELHTRTNTINNNVNELSETIDDLNDDVNNLKSDLNTFDCSALFMNGYFPIKGNVYDSFISQSNWRSCKIPVLPGEKVILTGSGSVVSRLWGFTTETGIITRVANANTSLDDAEFIAVDGEMYFVFNATTDSDTHPPTLKLSVDRSVALENLRETIYSDEHTFDCRRLFVNGYYITNGTFIGNFVLSDGYRTCILCVDEGERITLTGTGSTTARLWAFADENKRITRRADASESIEASTFTTLEGEKYFIYNSTPGTTNKVAYLSLQTNGIECLEDLRKRVYSIEYNNTTSRSIKNNLVSDGMWNLPHSRAIKNNTITNDNYGLPGTKYEVDLGDFNKCHVFFCYKHIDYVNYNGTDVIYPIASLGQNNALNLCEMYRDVDVQYGALYRTSFFYPANQNAANSVTLNPQFYNPLNGENAVFIHYTGEIDSNTIVNIVFSNSSISFVVNNNTIGTVQLNNENSIQSLVDSINAITNFSCEIRKSSGTINDLLLPASKTISMVESITRGGTQHYGSIMLSIPFKIDKRFHTCEFVVDKNEQKAYVAFDGVTRTISFSQAKALTDGILVLGGNYTTESNVIIKDLEIDINNLGDCEIVSGKITNASETNTTQLISHHNPRLMIFEGHGITTLSETEAQTAYVESGSTTSQEAMQSSTDRLNTVFDELNNRGYVPVTIPQIVNWKSGKGNLPKRCYACIFDDYRIENYLDYEKRKPMVKHHVIPALALITNMHNLSDTVTVNNVTYSIEEALQIIKEAEWFCCSHTASHRYINQYTIEENITLFEEDVISANKHFINSNVIVYPFGAVNAKTRRAFALSDFAVGITVVEERYNCLASADYLLSRTEIGTRASLENVLAPFI